MAPSGELLIATQVEDVEGRRVPLRLSMAM
jgi:hypothetical protein